MEYLKDVLKKKEEHYLLHYVDGEAVFGDGAKAIVPAGIEIEKRRDLMSVNKESDRQHDKFMISLPASVVTEEEKAEFKRKIMELWMLDGVVDPEDIILLDRRDYTNGDLFMLAQRSFENVKKTNTGLRVILGDVDYTDENILQINLSPEAKTNINQYEVFVNLVLTKDKEELLRIIDGLDNKSGNLYIYLPKVEAVDLEAEVKNYHRYVREILVKA